jgi:hypothetical protein
VTKYLDRLSQIASAANTVADLTRSTLVYRYPAAPEKYLYLHTSQSEARVIRHDLREIVITAHLQPPFAWRIASEQDEAGVYYVALRKMVVGVVASGRFDIAVPHDTHIILKLENVRLTLEAVSDNIDLPGHR